MTPRSPNQRALQRLTLLAILSGIVIIGLFTAVEATQIKSRAMETLTSFAAAPRTDHADLTSGRAAPDIAVVALDGDAADVPALAQALRDHASATDPAPGTIQRFADGRSQAYYFVQDAGALGLDETGTYLFYTDVSFACDVVRTAAFIMAGIFLALAALLYLSGRATIRLLDRKDASMRDFFANASHELKTPLMAIQGYADGLASGVIPKETACAVIDHESARMTALTNDILALSKLDSGILSPTLADTDLREVLYDALQSLAPQAAQRGIQLVPVLPKPLFVRCDEVMLYSVFANILVNSLRYAASRITITADAAPGPLCIRIANDGPAIAPETAAHIFERFYKGPDGQTGLGLALSQEYVALHGGSLRVAVIEDETTFLVQL